MDGYEQVVDLGKGWGQDHLLGGQRVGSQVMHSSFGVALPRVTKQELNRYMEAVFAYFEELREKLPKRFEYMGVLLEDGKALMEKVARAADERETAHGHG